MNYSQETFNEASVGGLVRQGFGGDGGQVRAAASFSKEKKPSSSPTLSTLLHSFSHLYFSYPPFHLSTPPTHAFSTALILSPLWLSLSLCIPPSSLWTPDTAHVQSFVWWCPFITGLNGKSIYRAEVHLMTAVPLCRCA